MSIHIYPKRLNEGKISSFQCGQFIEFLCDLVPGMYAEMVYDGSFEGLVPYKVEFIRQKDFCEQPWYPSGAVHRGKFELDSDNPFNGKVSQRITVQSGDPCTLGVSQDGMSIQRGRVYLFSCFLRQENLSNPVTVRIGKGPKTYAQYQFANVKEKWEKFHANLKPDRSDDDATLTIQFQAQGTIWIDKVSLVPKGNVNGWRQDCVRAIRALRPGIIRFGGCTVESYEWTEGVGDPDHRVPFTTIPWGGLEPNNIGLEEFITFCQLVDAEPLICLRYTGKTPQDAADQVEYFNGSVNTPFGRRRTANGHPKPYGVKYWQIGNEIEDPKYESELQAFCESMKRVNSTIHLLSSFASRELIRNAGTYLDYVCPHHYGCGNLAKMEAEIQRIRRDLEEIVPERKIKIAVTEWNTTGGDWGVGRNSLWTLENAIACARYHNLIQRYCDIVEIAVRSNLANSFCSGIIQTRGRKLFKTPTYYVDQLYSNHSGAWPLRVESEVPSDQLDISASLSSSGKKVHLFAVNSTLDKIPTKVDFSAFKEKVNQTKVWTVMDTKIQGERDVSNSLEDPVRIRIVKSKFASGSSNFENVFQPLTINAMECQFARRIKLPL